MACFSKVLGFILATALFIVTVSCTVDLLSQILPAKYWYLPACGAAAFDIGAIAWLLTLLHGVHNGEQRSVAWVLLFADFLGVATTSITDVFFYDATKGIVAAFPGDWVRWVVVAVVAVILINVAGWMAMHILHPKHIQAATGLKETPVARITAIRETTPTRRPAPRQLPAPKSTVRTKPQRQAAVAQQASVEVATDGDEEIAVLDDSPETEELDDLAENFPLDEENDEETDDTYTTQMATVSSTTTQEAANASVPLGQRLGEAWHALTGNDADLRGPTTLQKRRRR